MVKEPSEANCKNEVAEEGVVDAGKKQRAGALVGEGKEQATDHAEAHREPVAQDDVTKPKASALARIIPQPEPNKGR